MIQIPGEIFSQFHSGWKISFAYVEGAGYRVCVENPQACKFLSFRIEKENQAKLYDCLRQSNRNETQSGLPEKERLETDDLSKRVAS